MAMIAYGFSDAIASVKARSCSGEAMFCAKRQTPPRPARSRSRNHTGSTVPANPGSRVPSTLEPLPARLAFVGLDVVRGELKTRSRGGVQQHGDMWVQLQRRRWPHRRHRPFDELVDSLCFSAPRGHQHNVSGLEDGANALSEAVLRDSLHVSVEESGVVPSGLAGQGL